VTVAPILARQEHFRLVDSTNDVVAGWLAAGTPEVCLATAHAQTAGRGRDGRTWQAPPGTSLLLSLGFRPTWLAPDRTWQLAAFASLAMAGAGEHVAGLPEGAIRLKWPNDLVIESPEGLLKLAGVLGETAGLGGPDPQVVVGIGLNVDWRRADFPADLAAGMTSLREAAGDRAIDPARLRDAFVARLEPGIIALRQGTFSAAEWRARQVSTGREVDLVDHDGGRRRVRAVDVDAESGGLVVEDRGAASGRRTVLSGEIRHVRLPAATAVGV
jgi:BirA family biotin operon repressor/biotin-[acetyl-CoA-carboxylase] ligase